MALAPRIVQNMPDCFRRQPITVLQPASITPEPMNQVLTAELWVAHTLGVALEVVRLGANLFQNFGIGGFGGAQREDQLFDLALVEEPFLVDLDPGLLPGWIVDTVCGPIPAVLSVIQIDDLRTEVLSWPAAGSGNCNNRLRAAAPT